MKLTLPLPANTSRNRLPFWKSNPEHRHRSSWKIIRELTYSNFVPSSKIPGGSTEERLNILFENFISESLHISCDRFDSSELDLVFKYLNSSKSPALDNTSPSIWRLPCLREDLLGFFTWTTDSIILISMVTSQSQKLPSCIYYPSSKKICYDSLHELIRFLSDKVRQS